MNHLSPEDTLTSVAAIIATYAADEEHSLDLAQIHHYFFDEIGYDINNTILLMVLDKLKKDGLIKNPPGLYTSYIINKSA